MNDLADGTLMRPDASAALVPAAFAEKAMATVMQLHGELMEEKERRVELYRRLMEKEQAVAELRMYVRMLEERAGIAAATRPDEPRAATPEDRAVRAKPAPQAAPLSDVRIDATPSASNDVVRPTRSADASNVVEMPARASPSGRAPHASKQPPTPPQVGTQRAANEGWKVW